MSKRTVLWIILILCIPLAIKGIIAFMSFQYSVQDQHSIEIPLPLPEGEDTSTDKDHTVVLLDIDDMIFIGKGDSSLQYQWSNGLHIDADSAQIMDIFRASKDEAIIVKAYENNSFHNMALIMHYLASIQATGFVPGKIAEHDLAFLATQRDTSRHKGQSE